MGNLKKELLQKHDQKLKFGAVGIFNTGLDFALLFIGVWLGLPKIGANYISTGIAFLSSFFMNRKYTFGSQGSARKQFMPFMVVTIIGLWVLQPLAILGIMSFGELINEHITLFLAKILATLVSMTWNYFMYKKFVFKN